MNKYQYKTYLRSEHWHLFRERVLLRTFVNGKYKCEDCGELFSRNELEVHHKHYRSLWNEKPSDVRVLCGICHTREHGLDEAAKQNAMMIKGHSRKQNVFAEIMAVAYEKLKPIHKRMIDGVITQQHFDAIKREFIDMLLNERQHSK
jgi:hypothetical protein